VKRFHPEDVVRTFSKAESKKIAEKSDANVNV